MKSDIITIVDYKMGNLESVKNMLKRVGHKSVITSDPVQLKLAQKIILPGVGAFDAGMANLKELGMLQVLNGKAFDEKVPIMGICLGMQLLSCSSQEGVLPGLGWIKAKTVRFDFKDLTQKYKVPHMGWNTVSRKKESKLFDAIEDGARFYFVHSYHLVCDEPQDIMAVTDYGYEFISVVESRNIIGVQFHPEKSHRYGMQILKNFAESY